MKKFFKKSISCIIAVLMVISAMPFTALTANAALAYVTTGDYNFESSVYEANTVTDYTGSNFVMKAKAWDRSPDIQTNNLNTIVSTYDGVRYTSAGTFSFSYDGGTPSVTTGINGLYVYDGLVYIDNISDYIYNGGFRISWTEQYFRKSSASGAGVFSLGTGATGDVLKWTTNDNKLYVGGSEALVKAPDDGTVYDITLTSGTDKKINVLVKNHSTKATVIDYTTSGTYEPSSLKYLVIGSCDQTSNALGRFALNNLKIEMAYDSSDPTAAFKESAQYVKANVESFNGYTGTVTQSADNADGYNSNNFASLPASSVDDKMSNVLYAAGCVNAPYTKSVPEYTAAKSWGISYNVAAGLQYGNMVFLYDGVNDCANIVMSYAYCEADEGGMRNLVPTTAGFELKSNWHSSGSEKDKSYTGNRNWAFGPIGQKSHQMHDHNKNNFYFYNTLYYTGKPTETITTVSNITWHATIFSTKKDYDRKNGDVTFGNTNNTNGTTTVYVVNYKPIKDKVSAIKSTYEKVKTAGDTAYCANSLGAYYRAVEKVLKLNPNSYEYSTNLSNAVTNVGRDIDDVINNYLTTATTEPTKHSTATTQENVVASTCTASGSYDEVVKCSVCKVELSRTQKTTDPLGHRFTNYVSNNNATCETNGTQTATCENGCGVEDTIDIPNSALNHNYTSEITKAATCTERGEKTFTCQNDNRHTYTEYIGIDENAHKWGNWTKVDSTNHRRVCEYNNDHTQTEAHDMDGNTCRKCGYIAKVTITFKAKDGSVIRSDDYDIGADIVIPDLPNPVYTPNGDGATHTKVTYAWDNEPQTTAQTEATYTVVQTTDNADACQFGVTPARTDVIIEGKTYDIFTCTLCHGEKQVRVADKDALNEAILQLQNDLDLPEAGYKYDAALVEAARNLINEANALGRYADQSVVDAKARKLKTSKNELNAAENLAKYNIKFQIVKDDGNGNASLIKEYTDGYASLSYGSVVEFDKYVIPTVTDKDSPIFGLPQYAVYKWVKYENGVPTKLSTTNINISDIVKSDATYICYLLDFKATDETQTKTRVRYLDKSGHTIDFDQATIGQPYTRKDTSKAPVIPYYTCTGWEPVFGDESNVGTRELVYKPIYTYKDSLANKCEIVGLNGVKVNGEERCQAIYDERIELSGADMFAYADENGSIIARINANYIYAPHIYGVSKTIYITKVETATEKAETLITGTFTIDNPNNTNIKYLVVNGQYYLPENAKVVECGIVIGNVNDAEALKIGSAVKVKSDSQGENHEYSVQMSYTKGKTGTLYSRSYLIYVDANGATQTVYSDAVTECIID